MLRPTRTFARKLFQPKLLSQRLVNPLQSSGVAAVEGSAAITLGATTISSAGYFYSVDASSGKPVPASSAEWGDFIAKNSLTIASPTALYLCQESSGNLTDTIGGIGTLTANGTPLYAQSVSGWTRAAVGFNQGAAQRFLQASGPNVSTSSVATFMYLHIPGFDASVRSVLTMGTSDNISVYGFTSAGKSVLRIRGGGQIVTGAVDHDFDVTGDVIALLAVSNLNASGVEELKLYTQYEELTPGADPSTPASNTNYALGPHAGATPVAGNILYSCAWTGTAGQITSAQALALFTALGYAPSWS